MVKINIDAAELADVPAFERRHRVKLLSAEIRPKGRAVVEVLPVATVDWFVKVQDERAALMLADGSQYINAAALFALDADVLVELVECVVYEDNDSDINLSGWYYPQSAESLALFERLMATARPKGSAPS
jgi:hypothetical protein